MAALVQNSPANQTAEEPRPKTRGASPSARKRSRSRRVFSSKRRVVGGHEAHGREDGGDPGQPPLCRHQGQGIGERVGDEQVGLGRGRQQGVVGLAQMGHDQLADQVFRAMEFIEYLAHQGLAIVQPREAGRYGHKVDTRDFHGRAILLGRGDHGLVTALD